MLSPTDRRTAGVLLALPSARDPRLRLAVVITSLQVLGQTLLRFKLSIAQILITIGVCAVGAREPPGHPGIDRNVGGALWVLRPLRLWPMVVAFFASFGVLVAVNASLGRCFLAAWHNGPVCGTSYWLNLVASPELPVFVVFMISDPKTAPRMPLARVIYGMAVALAGAGLILLQPSEFGVKVALLAGLTVVCTLVPLMDRWLAGTRPSSSTIRPHRRTVAIAAVITVAVPAAVVVLASDRLVVAIDGRNSPASSLGSGPIPSEIPLQ